jgi:hypothetical protein
VRLKTLLAAELWRGRDFEAARPVLERLLAVAPDSAELNYELGDLHLQQAEPEPALASESLRQFQKISRASAERKKLMDGEQGIGPPELTNALPCARVCDHRVRRLVATG